MPRGKYVNHKGRGRSFTSPEELAREQKIMKEKRERREAREGGSSSEEEQPAKKEEEKEEESSSEEEEEDDENRKSKGVSYLLAGEIENPNHRVLKPKKLSKLEDTSGGNAAPQAKEASAAPELSRREREAIEKQKAKERYQKLHAEGKTEEARADLARLAIIKKQREEAAQKRKDELAQKESLKATSTLNKLGKK